MVKLISEEEKMGENTFTKCFIPENDPELKRIGLEVCAVTKVEDSRIKNRIIFKKGSETSDIECIHTAVCQLVKNPESKTGFEVVSTEKKPFLKMLLSPEDHFFSLKSFTQALVETGIEASIINGLEEEKRSNEAPLDMNHLMRKQIANALIKIAPRETKNIALSVLEYVVGDNPDRWEQFGNDFRSVICSDAIKGEDIKRLINMAGDIHNFPTTLLECILRNPNLPLDLFYKIEGLKEYLHPANFYLRGMIAENPNLPNDLILKLYNDKDSLVSNRIIHFQHLPDTIIKELMDDQTSPKLIRLAGNSSISKDIMNILSYNPRTNVRESLALNDSLTDDLLQKLSEDENAKVRESIAVRKELPVNIIEKLAGDRRSKVRQCIANYQPLTLEQINTFLLDANLDVRMGIAGREDIPFELVKKLMEDPDPDIRSMIADREDLPIDAITLLANDDNHNVLETLHLMVMEREDVPKWLTDLIDDRLDEMERSGNIDE